jgi:hypothetical protein
MLAWCPREAARIEYDLRNVIVHGDNSAGPMRAVAVAI